MKLGLSPESPSKEVAISEYIDRSTCSTQKLIKTNKQNRFSVRRTRFFASLARLIGAVWCIRKIIRWKNCSWTLISFGDRVCVRLPKMDSPSIFICWRWAPGFARLAYCVWSPRQRRRHSAYNNHHLDNLVRIQVIGIYRLFQSILNKFSTAHRCRIYDRIVTYIYIETYSVWYRLLLTLRLWLVVNEGLQNWYISCWFNFFGAFYWLATNDDEDNNRCGSHCRLQSARTVRPGPGPTAKINAFRLSQFSNDTIVYESRLFQRLPTFVSGAKIELCTRIDKIKLLFYETNGDDSCRQPSTVVSVCAVGRKRKSIKKSKRKLWSCHSASSMNERSMPADAWCFDERSTTN